MATTFIHSNRAQVLIDTIISTEYTSARQVRKAIREFEAVLKRVKNVRRRFEIGKSLESLVMLQQAFE